MVGLWKTTECLVKTIFDSNRYYPVSNKSNTSRAISVYMYFVRCILEIGPCIETIEIISFFLFRRLTDNCSQVDGKVILIESTDHIISFAHQRWVLQFWCYQRGLNTGVDFIKSKSQPVFLVLSTFVFNKRVSYIRIQVSLVKENQQETINESLLLILMRNFVWRHQWE